MGNCCESQHNFLTVIYAINGEAENGFAKYTSCNYPDILPVGEVNRLISGVNSAIQATKSLKKYTRLRKPQKCLALFACFTWVAFPILLFLRLLTSNCKVCGEFAGLVIALAIALTAIVVINGYYLENMITNAIQSEVDAWNWSKRFVQAKYKPSERRGDDTNSHHVPARLKFYRWPSHGREVINSPLAFNAASHI